VHEISTNILDTLVPNPDMAEDDVCLLVCVEVETAKHAPPGCPSDEGGDRRDSTAG
jgi:hypothetical protein